MSITGLNMSAAMATGERLLSTGPPCFARGHPGILFAAAPRRVDDLCSAPLVLTTDD